MKFIGQQQDTEVRYRIPTQKLLTNRKKINDKKGGGLCPQHLSHPSIPYLQ